MRFSRYPKLIERQVTGRRLQAAHKALARERAKERAPGFTGKKAAETVEERVARVDAQAREGQQRFRDHIASEWIRGRRLLRSLPPEQRQALEDEWNGKRWLPGSSEYFLDFLHTALGAGHG